MNRWEDSEEGEGCAGRGGVDPEVRPSRAANAKVRSSSWRSYIPLAMLILAGTIVSGATLVRMLKQLGQDRVVRLEVPAAVGSAPLAVAALDAIDEEYVARWVEELSSEALGGRDTPSRGLDQAQELVAAEFQRMGLVPAADSSGPLDRRLSDPSLRGYFAPFRASAAFFDRVPFEGPDRGVCALELAQDSGALELYMDFVPLARSSMEDPIFGGEAFGDVVFAGFGIDSTLSDYDDFQVPGVAGKIAVVLAGEPGGGAFIGRFLDGEESTEACVWNKLDALSRAGATGALVVEFAGDVAAEPLLDFHRTRAYWNPPTMDRVRGGLPTLRVTAAAASRVLGEPVEALRDEIIASGAPLGREVQGPSKLRLAAGTLRDEVELRNVVGVLPGTQDGSFIVVGAHLDHIGVGPRGRIGRGADDNGSGMAAMLAVAKAMVTEDGRGRLAGTSVIFCAFTGEEDGLLGSKAYAQGLGEARSRCRLMINLDMVGSGDPASAVVLGLGESPGLIEPFHRVVAAGNFGLDAVQEVTSKSFFPRSDHYSFYEVGIPALFLFESWPHETGVYHTWRDLPAGVNAGKVASVARLATLVAFELAR